MVGVEEWWGRRGERLEMRRSGGKIGGGGGKKGVRGVVRSYYKEEGDGDKKENVRVWVSGRGRGLRVWGNEVVGVKNSRRNGRSIRVKGS